MEMISRVFLKLGGSNFQSKILASFCIVLTISSTVAGTLSLILVRNYAKETFINHSEQALSLVSKNIDRTMESIENTSKQVLLSEAVVEYCVRADVMSEYERVTQELSFSQDFFANTLRSNTLISSIMIYPTSGYSLSFGLSQKMSTDDYQEQEIYKTGIEKSGPHWFGSRSVLANYGLTDNIISLTRPVFNFDSEEIVGLLEIQIPTENISSNLLEFNTMDGSGVLLLDENGAPAVSSSMEMGKIGVIYEAASRQIQMRQKSTRVELDGDHYLLNCGMLKNGWMLVHYQPMKNLTRTSDAVGLAIVLVGVIMLLCMIGVSSGLSKQLVQPLREAIEATGKISAEDLEYKNSDEEITALFNNYNYMMQCIRESELNTLRAQITPHFLYNTLNSIKCRALLDGSRDVAQMTQWLVDLLEASINNHSEYLTLNEEIDMLKSYTGLQQMRSDRVFILRVEITRPQLGRCLIPKMILQTLVENAILHGIEEKEGEGIITVYAAGEDNELQIEVRDNGIGMSEERIKEVLAGREEVGKSRMNRVGIYNVDQRIKLYFGKSYGVSITSGIMKGTTVRIRMPQVEDPVQFRKERIQL